MAVVSNAAASAQPAPTNQTLPTLEDLGCVPTVTGGTDDWLRTEAVAVAPDRFFFLTSGGAGSAAVGGVGRGGGAVSTGV